MMVRINHGQHTTNGAADGVAKIRLELVRRESLLPDGSMIGREWLWGVVSSGRDAGRRHDVAPSRGRPLAGIGHDAL